MDLYYTDGELVIDCDGSGGEEGKEEEEVEEEEEEEEDYDGADSFRTRVDGKVYVINY